MGQLSSVFRECNTPSKAHDEFARRHGPTHPGHKLFDEADRPALSIGRALAHTSMEHLAGVGAGGQERAVAEFLGVAIAGPALGLAAHLAVVESRSITSWSDPGPAPSAQARRSTSANTASSWLRCPMAKARGNVPNVDGTMTRCGSTEEVDPKRSTLAWSMCEPPAAMAWTKVSTLRPGDAPPTRSEKRSVALTRGSRPRQTGRIVDGCDGLVQGFARSHGHGERDPQAKEPLEGLIRPISRIETHDDLAACPGVGRCWATNSSTKRLMPRAVLADPLRIRAWRIPGAEICALVLRDKEGTVK